MTAAAKRRADLALREVIDRWDDIRARLDLPESYAPKSASSRTGRWRYYGCGKMGCAMPALDPEVTVKLTDDPQEALGMAVLARPGRDGRRQHKLNGMATSYAVALLPIPGEPMYAIWREAVDDPGAEGYGAKTADKLLLRWDNLASSILDRLELLEDQDDSPEALRRTRTTLANLPRAARGQGSLSDIASDMLSLGELADRIAETRFADEIGWGLRFYLDQLAIIADLHLDNIGVTRGRHVVFDVRMWGVGDSLDSITYPVAW